MKTSVHETINGKVARVPIWMPDLKRSLRRLRPVIGRKPIAIKTGGGFTVYAARDSIAAAVHLRRLREIIP